MSGYNVALLITRKQDRLMIISPEDQAFILGLGNLSTVSGYARKKNYLGQRDKEVLVHRLILEQKIGRPLLQTELCDHLDGNPQNNTRQNLRVATKEQNAYNSKIRKNNTSGFRNVHWCERDKNWSTYINVNKKRKYLGIFSTPEEAYDVYCKASKQYHGDFSPV